ncbi:MAG: glycosyltransferase family 4 protein [Candidatus Methylacidiphilales bacterium]|nr:glycosyltransferase family 4 protein [Candidatus Methylacidiphilales bacterium]
MKIGFFLPNATFDLPGTVEVGGIESFAFTVGEAMQEMGHEVVLFGGKPKFGRSHRVTPLRLRLFDYWETRRILNLGTRFQRLVQRVHFGLKCHRAWLDEKFDVAILAKPFDWPVAWRWKAVQPNQRIIMGWHGTDFYPGDSFFYRSVDAAFAVSNSVADQALKRVGSRPVVIPNPVDTQIFSPAEDLPEPTTMMRLAAHGRLVGWKGFAHLIEAIAIAKEAGLKVACQIAGEGPQQKELEALIKQHDVELNVRLTGRLDHDDLRELLNSADAYVAPSVGDEAFSIAAAEAVSVGLPVLLSSKIGLREYLGSQDCLTFQAGDVKDLAKGLQELSARRMLSSWNNRAARHSRVKNLFSARAIANKILALQPGQGVSKAVKAISASTSGVASS